MMVIDNKYNIGQIVYLKTDPDQNSRMVVMIQISGKDILYQLASGTMASWHFDFEITIEKDILIIQTN